MKKYFMIIAAFLTACGGGGSTTGAALTDQSPVVNAPTVPVPVVYKKLNVEMYGDSSLEGSNVNPLDAAKPCEMLQNAVDVRYGAGQVNVRCQAFGSDSQDLVTGGSQYVGGPWPQILSYDANAKTYTKSVPDVVLINHNLNDIRNRRSLLDYQNNMEFLLKKAKAVGVKTVVLENSVPLTTKSPYGATQEVLNTQPAYLDALREVASANSAPLVDTYSTVKSFANWENYITDSIHPNAQMYRSISDNRVKVLLPFLDGLRQP
jgi:lysophospholipase L1-like esterase